MTTGPDSDRDATQNRIETYLRLQEAWGFSKWAVVDRQTRILRDWVVPLVRENAP